MKKPSMRVIALLLVGFLALIYFGLGGVGIGGRSVAKWPASPATNRRTTSGIPARTAENGKPERATAIIPKTGAALIPNATRAAETTTFPHGLPSQPLPAIRNQEAPVAGRAEMVPGHFDGVRVSHVPLPAPPPEVKPGTPRTPPRVVHPTPEQGGGTLFLLDSTWDTPVHAHPPAASDKGAPPPKPPSSPSK